MDNITFIPRPVLGTAENNDGSPILLDILQVQEGRLFFPKLPDVVFFLQNIQLPSINVNSVSQNTRYVDTNEIGEKVNYAPFSITFLVDKQFKNWSSIFNWMKRMSVAGTVVGDTDNPVLIIDGKETLRFIGSWPTSLGGIELASTVSESQNVKATLTINYDYMDLLQWTTADSSYQ